MSHGKTQLPLHYCFGNPDPREALCLENIQPELASRHRLERGKSIDIMDTGLGGRSGSLDWKGGNLKISRMGSGRVL